MSQLHKGNQRKDPNQPFDPHQTVLNFLTASEESIIAHVRSLALPRADTIRLIEQYLKEQEQLKGGEARSGQE